MATTISNLVTNPLGQAIQSKINPNPISLNPLSYAKAPTPTQTNAVPGVTQALPNGGVSNMTPDAYSALVARNRATQAAGTPTATAPSPSPQPQPQPQPPSIVNPNANMFGNATGSGAGQTVTAQNQQPPFNQAVTGLLGAPGQNAAVSQNTKDITDYYRGLINPITRGMVGQEVGDRTTGTQQVGEGNAQAAAQAGGELIKGLTNQEQNELTGTGQQLTAQSQAQSGLSSAGTLTQPSGNYPFVFDPTTGTYKNAAGGGVVSPLDAAKALNVGQMSPDQAASALSYLGPSAQAQLTSAMQGVNPSFNWNQAQTNSQVQGQLAPQAQTATQELQNLKDTLAKAPGFQQTSFPLINSLDAWYNQVTGNASSQQVSDARSAAVTATETALATAYGGTPSTWDSLISGWFPPNASPAQIQAGIDQFNQLMQYRVQSYASPGTVPLPTTGTSGGGFTEGQTATSGGMNFVYKNGQWQAS